MDLEVRHLRCFLVLAEELNFTRAAARLGIPQPALSTQIRRIERHLGTALFDRTTRSVVLTEAGRTMLPLARSVDQAMRGLEDAMRSPELPRRVRFGTDDMPMTVHVTEVENAFPGLSFELRIEEPPGCFSAVTEGRLDMVYAYDSPLLPIDAKGEIRIATVLDMPWWVALPKQHPLAQAERVSLRQLAGDAWFARAVGSPMYKLTIAQCQRYGGFTPDIRYTTRSNDVMFELMEQGRAVGFATPTTERYHGPFEVVPLTEEFGRRLLVAWAPATVATPVAEALVKQLRLMHASHVVESPKFHKVVLAAPDRFPQLYPLVADADSP